MNNLFRAAGASVSRAFDGFRFWANQSVASGRFGSVIRWFRDTDPRKKAGAIYDNGVVSIAIGWYWRNLTYPRIRVMRKVKRDGENVWEEVDGHALPEALERGPYYDHTVLFHGTLISWMVAGSAYWYKVRSRSGLVIGYVYVPHFLIRPMADKYNPDGTKLITYYEYTVPGGRAEELAVEDVVHLRCGIDPKDPQQGLAPLAGVLAEVGTDNLATQLTASLMANAGIPGIVIAPKGDAKDVTPEKREEFKRKWKDNTTGENAGSPNMIPFAVDVSVLGFSPDQLALDKTTRMQVSRICAAAGLDPMVLGLPSDSKTYSNYGEAIRASYDGALMPLLNIWGLQIGHQTLDDWLDSEKGDRIGWDTSTVPALQEDEDKKNDRWLKRWEKNLVDREVVKRALGMKSGTEDTGVYYADTQPQRTPVAPAAKRMIDQAAKKRREAERGVPTET
ncbi:phage portal protein [bacterium]|nr:MAG: phage portal protein [bacterium]